MPYSRRKGSRGARSVSSRSYRTRGQSRSGRSAYRKRKYTKVSKKRTTWTPGTTVTPFRRFVYNDEAFSLSLSNLTTPQWAVFRGNSCYDPDYSGTGVQPYGWDQLCPVFYTNYNVKASKITVYPSVNQTYSPSFPSQFECLVVPYRETSIPYSEMSDLRRMPYARSVRFNSASSSTSPPRVSSYCTTKSMWGKEISESEDAVAQYNGNPVSTWYWYVFMDDTAWASGTAVPVKFDVKIVYYTKLLRKAEFNES